MKWPIFLKVSDCELINLMTVVRIEYLEDDTAKLTLADQSTLVLAQDKLLEVMEGFVEKSKDLD